MKFQFLYKKSTLENIRASARTDPKYYQSEVSGVGQIWRSHKTVGTKRRIGLKPLQLSVPAWGLVAQFIEVPN